MHLASPGVAGAQAPSELRRRVGLWDLEPPHIDGERSHIIDGRSEPLFARDLVPGQEPIPCLSKRPIYQRWSSGVVLESETAQSYAKFCTTGPSAGSEPQE